jgi:hypothetical protein
MDLEDDMLISRGELTRRWRVSVETFKRREKARILRPIRMGMRAVSYRLSDIVRIEEQAADRYEKMEQ